MNKYAPIFLYLLAIAMLVPGLTLPMLTIKAMVDKQQMLRLTVDSVLASDKSGSFVQKIISSIVDRLDVEGSIQVFEKTRSILGTVVDLTDSGHWLVAVLIGLFAVIIPFIKIALVLVVFVVNKPSVKSTLLVINGYMSKWSMSDVFVMALLVTFLTVNANEQTIRAVQMNAQLESGFYFFAAYCLLAIAAGQAMQKFYVRDDDQKKNEYQARLKE